MRVLMVLLAAVAVGSLPAAAGGGGVFTPITSGSGDDDWPVYSPDGSKIAFLRGASDGTGGIYVVDADGANARRVSRTNAVDPHASWSPDGSRVALADSGDVHLVAADGTGGTNLTSTPSTIESAPDWSSTGRIVYVSDANGTDDVYVSYADGTGVVNVTNSAGALERIPEWSPDGTRIAFVRGGEGTADRVLVMRADGTGVTDVGEAPAAHGLTWSPDGTKLAYVAYATVDDSVEHVYVANADGTGARVRLTADPSFAAIDPAWAPDGRIAFASWLPGQPDAIADIYAASADGTGLVNLTQTADTDEVGPAWSPDGRTIAFRSAVIATGGNPDIVALNLTQPYAFTGFLAPVDNLPVLNAVQAGSAIPVRFSLGGDRGLDVFADGYPKSEAVSCESTAPVNGVEETVSASASGLSYDAAAGRYVYVWKTSREWERTCRQLVLKLADGTSHRARFLFR